MSGRNPPGPCPPTQNRSRNELARLSAPVTPETKGQDTMLILTEAAAEVVKSFTSNPQVPDGAGLRIASSTPGTENPDSLQVTESDGARVYLEPQAATYLEDKVLDAQVDGQG